jgi:type II secretion system protein G
MKKRGFTLIELLIVVAIIGILAAIAVPNFMNAQIRAKIARCNSDMKALSTALEAYKVDNNRVPPWNKNRDVAEKVRLPNVIRYYRLTTPVSYMSSVPLDPFASYANPEDYDRWGAGYDYIETVDDLSNSNAWGHEYRINSWGPDFENGWGGNRLFNKNLDQACPDGNPQFVYNASNGLKSYGDIVWVGSKGGRVNTHLYCPIKNGY